jgi:hypothetical protein
MGMGNAFGTGSYGMGWWRVDPPGLQALEPVIDFYRMFSGVFEGSMARNRLPTVPAVQKRPKNRPACSYELPRPQEVVARFSGFSKVAQGFSGTYRLPAFGSNVGMT